MDLTMKKVVSLASKQHQEPRKKYNIEEHNKHSNLAEPIVNLLENHGLQRKITINGTFFTNKNMANLYCDIYMLCQTTDSGSEISWDCNIMHIKRFCHIKMALVVNSGLKKLGLEAPPIPKLKKIDTDDVDETKMAIIPIFVQFKYPAKRRLLPQTEENPLILTTSFHSWPFLSKGSLALLLGDRTCVLIMQEKLPMQLSTMSFSNSKIRSQGRSANKTISCWCTSMKSSSTRLIPLNFLTKEMEGDGTGAWSRPIIIKQLNI
ncbi:hypothetical protein VP01_1344g3 [Puccinia sorghi]|uniref:Uncharacterized protein n=1 Tax=Puccinia sorghi TaxID=27349 RepID=A0A0L6VMH5_9BASI|nr:hypothetical protein VP01_1344g3 [Puccinia sorghi]